MAVEAPARPRPIVPKINPILAPLLICTNKDCKEVLHPRAVKGQGGFVPDAVYVCPNCAYEFKFSFQPAIGQCRALSDKERDELERSHNQAGPIPAKE